MNDKILELVINIVWPKIQAAYGDQINEAFKLALNFKTFADELMARFERIENVQATILKELQDAKRRDNGTSFANLQIGYGASNPDTGGSGDGANAGHG